MGNIDRSFSQYSGNSNRPSNLPPRGFFSYSRFSNETKLSGGKREITRVLNGNPPYPRHSEIESSISSGTSDQHPINVESQSDDDTSSPKSPSDQLEAFGENYGVLQKFVDDANERNENQPSGHISSHGRPIGNHRQNSPSNLKDQPLSIRTSQNYRQSSLSRPPVLSPSALSSSSLKKRGSSDIIVVSPDDDDDDIIVPPKRRRPSQQTKIATLRTKVLSSHPVQVSAVKISLGGADSARKQFLENLKTLRGPVVSVVNQVDNTSPPLTFKFVNESILGSAVEAAPAEVMIGCECRKDNGRNIGCEYLSCDCLVDSALNSEGKKVFPYSAAKLNPGCLRDFYLESRHHIYECNANCNCEQNCKNRKVQHGRQVPLEIFKTKDRGWGLRCLVHLRQGEFIDTYRGKIIPIEEANKRGNNRTTDEGNYLMNFDKFTEPEAITKTEFLKDFSGHIKWHEKKVRENDWTIYTKNGEEMWLNPEHTPNKYVCDGMHVGGPTRFMNHSCDPNCRLFTASYNHSDPNLYDLAFFALEEIPAGTELTFDYKDEDDRSIITDAEAREVQARDGYMPQPCLCKAENCRRYFFN